MGAVSFAAWFPGTIVRYLFIPSSPITSMCGVGIFCSVAITNPVGVMFKILDGFPWFVRALARVVGSSSDFMPLMNHFIMPSGSSGSSGRIAVQKAMGLLPVCLKIIPQSLLPIPRRDDLSGMDDMMVLMCVSCS